MEDAGKQDHDSEHNVEESESKVLDVKTEDKIDELPSAVAFEEDVTKNENGGEDLNKLNNEATDKTSTKSEVEDQISPGSETNEPMILEGMTGIQTDTTSRNEGRSSTKPDFEERTAGRSTVDKLTDAKSEVVEQNATNGGVEEEMSTENIARNQTENANADAGNDPREHIQLQPEALQTQNPGLDEVPQVGDEEMEDGAKVNEDKPVKNEPKEQGKEIFLASAITNGDANNVEIATKQGDHSSILNQHEAATPSSFVRYPPAKSGDHSRETVKTIFTQAAVPQMAEGDDGTPESQAAFMKELESFYRERSMDFKPPKFYGQPLNCLKLWRAVIRLGGYDRVTGSKLWRQVGESFHPPKTCTTVSWTFRIFYEKALLEYERHKTQSGDLQLPVPTPLEAYGGDYEGIAYQGSGSGRVRRDSAARAMQGCHVQRLFGNGEAGDPVTQDKSVNNMAKEEKNVKSIGSLKQKRPNEVEQSVKFARTETSKQLVASVLDLGPPADWVKINVLQMKDCFEVYALVPGLIREEVRVQADPAGRLVIIGQPEEVDNPWGITPFKKVVILPARIDPHQASALLSLHGRLSVRAPFEASNN